jgi:Sucrose synthase
MSALHMHTLSDGNLVASLLSQTMFVTQCNIAHALEKTKYADADIKWCAQCGRMWLLCVQHGGMAVKA